MQLEQGVIASRYNLIQNGDFSKQGSTATIPADWEYGGGNVWGGSWNDTMRRATVPGVAAPQLDNNALQFVGDPTDNKRMNQVVRTNGKAGDVYYISGWVYGKTAPMDAAGKRKFGIEVSPSSGGSQSVWVYQPGSESEDFTGWRYIAAQIVVPVAHSSLTVSLCFGRNIGTVYFDGIQLFKDGGTHSYTYDGNGHVASATNAQGTERAIQWTRKGM